MPFVTKLVKMLLGWYPQIPMLLNHTLRCSPYFCPSPRSCFHSCWDAAKWVSQDIYNFPVCLHTSPGSWSWIAHAVVQGVLGWTKMRIAVFAHSWKSKSSGDILKLTLGSAVKWRNSCNLQCCGSAQSSTTVFTKGQSSDSLCAALGTSMRLVLAGWRVVEEVTRAETGGYEAVDSRAHIGHLQKNSAVVTAWLSTVQSL